MADDAKPNGHDALQTYEKLETLDNQILLDRLAFMRQAGITFNGARDTYELFGYDRIITAKQYRDTYARGGIAKRIVEAYPKATWRGGVELYEDEDPDVITPFEQAWRDLEQQLLIWQRFQQADILAGLSTYSVLLLGASGDMSTELPKGSPGKLLGAWPFAGGGGPSGLRMQVSGDANYVDASIWEFETDAKNARFGLPKMYQLRRTDFTSPQLQQPVHWSRIIHVAEGTLDNDVYGQPALENVWNLLADLEKVTGGGAEAFFLRANAGLQVDIAKDMALPPTPDELEKLKSDVEAYKHNITRILRTRGVSINQLGSDTANFAAPADAILKQIAGSKGIPLRILTGSEMGELASTQDAGNWRTQVQDRRTGYAGPLIVRRFVDRLIDYGYLPKPKQYEVGWPEEDNASVLEKAQLAVSLATVNKTQGTMVFLPREIREVSFDLEPLTPTEEALPVGPPQPAPTAAPKASADQPTSDQQRQVREDHLKTAEDAELLRVLTDAIEANNVEVIDRILGLHHND